MSTDTINTTRDDSFILLLGVEDELFTNLYGDHSKWKCRLLSLPEDSSDFELDAFLNNPGLLCVVIEDSDQISRLKTYYENGGFIVYFGYEGVFEEPTKISRMLDLEWNFSGYTKYEFVLTDIGKELLGYNITEQNYSKSVLLKVPVEDRLLIPKSEYTSLEAFMNDIDEDDQAAGQIKFDKYYEKLGEESPLVLHKADHGGRIAYLGFVNDEDNIPKFVRALCTGSKTTEV